MCPEANVTGAIIDPRVGKQVKLKSVTRNRFLEPLAVIHVLHIGKLAKNRLIVTAGGGRGSCWWRSMLHA